MCWLLQKPPYHWAMPAPSQFHAMGGESLPMEKKSSAHRLLRRFIGSFFSNCLSTYNLSRVDHFMMRPAERCACSFPRSYVQTHSCIWYVFRAQGIQLPELFAQYRLPQPLCQLARWQCPISLTWSDMWTLPLWHQERCQFRGHCFSLIQDLCHRQHLSDPRKWNKTYLDPIASDNGKAGFTGQCRIQFGHTISAVAISFWYFRTKTLKNINSSSTGSFLLAFISLW